LTKRRKSRSIDQVDMLRVSLTAAFGLLLLGTLAAGDAGAESEIPVPVLVTLLGPSAVRVRVAEGMAMPCDSSEARVIVEGKYEPGEMLQATSSQDCVCVQHTYEPFADTDWSDAKLVCRPMSCQKLKSDWRCTPAPDPTIRIDISSKRDE
jgi:hypothetical protein